MVSTNISIRISIKDITATGTTLYSETHSATTNQFGLFTLPVGSGTVVSGTFASINWATNAKFMKVEMDPTGGSSYTDMGTSQLLSVPYALVAGSTVNNPALSLNDLTDVTSTGATTNQVLLWNGTQWVPGNISGGDNWGTQTAVTNSTLSGNGTSVSPLGLAQQGASSGQVLKWNGTNWALGSDNVGASSGSVNVTARLIGDGTLANPLDIAQQAATAGQVLKWGGSSWVPSNDADAQTLNLIGNTLSLTNGGSVTLPTGTTYTAGTGINLGGNVITNTAPDQTVALTGTGGTTVTGTYPNFTINSTTGGGSYTAGTGISIVGNVITNTSLNTDAQTLSVVGNQLSISNGNSVTMPTGTTYTAGTGISLAGNIITNTAPNQTVGITAGTGISVTGAYPNFTITATGGGGSYTAGTGISIAGSVINSVWTASGNNIYNNNSANVGINNTAPTYKFDVNSTNTATAIYGKYSGTTVGNKGIWGSNQNSTSLGQGNIGVYGDYNGAAYGSGVVGIGFNGITALPASLDIGVYGSAASIGVYGAATGATALYGISNYIPVYGNNNTLVNATITDVYAVGNPAGYYYSAGGQGSYSISVGENTYGANTVSNGAVNVGNSITSTYNIGTTSYGLGGSFPTTTSATGIEAYAEAETINAPDYVTAIVAVPLSVGFTSTLAGYFEGDVDVTGFLTKGGGTFKIDHPLDPENKFLYHSFVESPDMMNIYNGNITTDVNGDATVTLPDYFDTLNKDFRYQLTAVGTFAQVMIAEKISGNQFKIKSNQPNVEISWQVTGVRQDKFANAHRVVPEVNKIGKEKGRYLHPELYGLSLDQGIGALHFSNGLKKSTDMKLNLAPVSTNVKKTK